MWWLERADLLKRGASGAHQLGTYPRTADLWLKDKLHDKESKRAYRKPLDFTLKPVRRPDINPLRPDLRIPIEEVLPFDEKDSTGFEIPSSWRERLKEKHTADGKKYRLEKEEEVVIVEKELTPAEKEQILLEQEGFVAKKRLRWRVRARSPEVIEPEQRLLGSGVVVKPRRFLGPRIVRESACCQCETCFMSSESSRLGCKSLLNHPLVVKGKAFA